MVADAPGWGSPPPPNKKMEKCRHCGMIHGLLCPSVKAIEYYPDGTIKRVEYVTTADFASIQLAAPDYQPNCNPRYPRNVWQSPT